MNSRNFRRTAVQRSVRHGLIYKASNELELKRLVMDLAPLDDYCFLHEPPTMRSESDMQGNLYML